MSIDKDYPLPSPAPYIDAESKRFWDATCDDRLLLSRCERCARTFWYPKAICVRCGARPAEWFEASGSGRVYSFAVTQRGIGAYRDCGPYVLAYVELAEGPRVLTNIVGPDLDSLAVGQPVKVVFYPTDGPAKLPRFTPTI